MGFLKWNVDKNDVILMRMKFDKNDFLLKKKSKFNVICQTKVVRS